MGSDFGASQWITVCQTERAATPPFPGVIFHFDSFRKPFSQIDPR
jgi:hypothetical protein